MDNGNVLDKIYLALELTKIRYSEGCTSDEEIMKTFFFNIEKLTNTKLEDIEKIQYLKKELHDLHLDYDILKNTFNDKLDEILNKTYDKTLKYLDSSKGDMEDYVYKDLKELITHKK